MKGILVSRKCHENGTPLIMIKKIIPLINEICCFRRSILSDRQQAYMLGYEKVIGFYDDVHFQTSSSIILCENEKEMKAFV